MNKAMPTIGETGEELKARMSRERHPLKRQRLHALYLVASGQAKSRRAVTTMRDDSPGQRPGASQATHDATIYVNA